MKKIMFLFAFVSAGLFASASNGVKKENNTLVSKLESKTFVKGLQKTFIELCIEIDIYTSTCPDGSGYIAAVDVFIVDCTTGQAQAGQTVYNADADVCD
jgi:hypothetical protein